MTASAGGGKETRRSKNTGRYPTERALTRSKRTCLRFYFVFQHFRSSYPSSAHMSSRIPFSLYRPSHSSSIPHAFPALMFWILRLFSYLDTSANTCVNFFNFLQPYTYHTHMHKFSSKARTGIYPNSISTFPHIPHLTCTISQINSPNSRPSYADRCIYLKLTSWHIVLTRHSNHSKASSHIIPPYITPTSNNLDNCNNTDELCQYTTH